MFFIQLAEEVESPEEKDEEQEHHETKQEPNDEVSFPNLFQDTTGEISLNDRSTSGQQSYCGFHSELKIDTRMHLNITNLHYVA